MSLHKSGVSKSSKFTNAIINLSSFTFVKQSAEHVVPTSIQLDFSPESEAGSKSCTSASPRASKQPAEATPGQSNLKPEEMEETLTSKYGRRTVPGGIRFGSKSLPECTSEASNPIFSGGLHGVSAGLTKCGRTRTSGEDDPKGAGRTQSRKDGKPSGCRTGNEVITSGSHGMESTDAVSNTVVPTNPQNGEERKQSASPRKCSSVEPFFSDSKISKVSGLFPESSEKSRLDAKCRQLSGRRFGGRLSNELLPCNTENKDPWKSTGISGSTGDVLWRDSSFGQRKVLKRKRSASVEDSRSVHSVSRSPNEYKIQVSRPEPFSLRQKFSTPTPPESSRPNNGDELSLQQSCTSTITEDTRHKSLQASIFKSSVSGRGRGERRGRRRRNVPVKTCSIGTSSTLTSSPNGLPSSSPNGSPSSSPNGTPSSSPIGTPSSSPNGTPTSSPNGSCSSSPNGSSQYISEAITQSTRPSNLPTGGSSSCLARGPWSSHEQSSPCSAQPSWQSETTSDEQPTNVSTRTEDTAGASSEVKSSCFTGVATQLPATRNVGDRRGAAGLTPTCVLAEQRVTAPSSKGVASSDGERRAGEAIPTLEDAKCIQAIDRTAVHRICSGQVVVNLATAVKELVENSLDAGSSSVEVRLTGHGAASVVVSDDGPGVHPKDFEALALKHHTSKLRDFNGVCGIATYGFRGEALSSLCALSALSVCTRHASQPLALLLTYDRDGRLVQQKPASRQVGTTVTLNSLFSSLPVRRREFERKLKKEYHKMLQVLYSYAIISTNIRLHVVNQADGRRNTVLSTSCFPSVRDNIEALYGAKQMKTLLDIQERVSLDPEEEADDAGSASDGDLRLEGYISTCSHGQGRSAPDRQFYFVNNRPCDPVKVSRLVNEVYHTYNRHQHPFVVLNILMERRSVDVNLTPDKRQVMMHNEKLLLTTIKNSLLRLYEDVPNTLPLYNSTSLISPSQNYKLNSAQKQSKLSFHDETSSTADTRSRKNILTWNSNEHASATTTASTNDDTLTSDCADSDMVASSIPQLHVTAQTVGVAPSQTLSRRLHVSKNSPGLAIVSAQADKGKEASCSNKGVAPPQCSVIEEVSCGSDPTRPHVATLLHSNAALNKRKSEGNEIQRDSQTCSITIAQNESHVSQNIDGRFLHSTTPSVNSCNAESPISHNTEKLHPKGHSIMPVCTLPVDTDLKPQINRRNYDTYMSSPCSKRDNSFEEFLPLSPKKKRARFHLKGKDYNEANGSVNNQETDFLSGLSESPDRFPDNTPPHSEVIDDTDEKPKFSASSKRNSLLHEATESFLSRLASSKTAHASKMKAHDNEKSGVRKSLRKFVFGAEQEQEKSFVPAEPKDCENFTQLSQLETSKNCLEGDSRNLGDGDGTEPCVANGTQDATSCRDSETLVCYDDAFGSKNHIRKTKLVHFSLKNLRETFAKRSRDEGHDQKKVARNFHAKIAPSDNRAAEAELNKVLSKDMFAKMKILGQFNLGFLITQLESDLFIIDQHATDEKYNFETLQQTCILRHQPLIQPQSLQLTPANETVLIDNLKIFSANGFQLDVDESLPFGERVRLKSVPQSRNWSFGKDDIEELIFMLSDAPGVMCRPSRVRAMFASRACRTSVMVGTALSQAQMRVLVDHMGQIEQPWNCPHGRPTVRHLINLDMISK